MHRHFIALRAALPFAFALPVAASAAGPWSLTFRAEYDRPANTDRYYSNGVSAGATEPTGREMPSESRAEPSATFSPRPTP